MTKPQILAALNRLIDDHWDRVYSRPAVEIDAQTRGVLADALGALFVVAVVDEELVEKVARAICASSGKSWREGVTRGLNAGYDLDQLNNQWRHFARAALTACEPIIRADEREECAKVAESRRLADRDDPWNAGWDNAAEDITNAIRNRP